MLSTNRLDFLKSLFVLFSAFLLTIGTAQAGAGTQVSKAPGAAGNKIKHVIFFVHGLVGTEGTFAEFKESIEQDPDLKDHVLVGNLTYPTVPVNCNLESNDWLHPFHFAKVISSKITHFYYENAKKGLIDLQTPYTIMAHSQGGLVSMVYLNSCMTVDQDTGKPWCPYREGVDLYLNLVTPEKTDSYREFVEKKLADAISDNPQDYENMSLKGFVNKYGDRKAFRTEFFQEYPGCKEFHDHATELAADRINKNNFLDGYASVPNIENFITLGSPLWGSATANRGQTMRDILDGSWGADIDAMAPLEQLMRLGIGSRGTSWQRMFYLNRNATPEHKWTEDTPWTSPYPEGMKVFSTSGDLCEAYNFWEQRDAIGVIARPLIKACRYESDIIVGAPAARPDFIYKVENEDPSKASLTGVTDLGTAYYGTKVPHIPFSALDGMTTVHLENHKNHSSYILAKNALLNSINGTDNPMFSEEQMEEHMNEDYENFMSELKLVTPKGYHRQFAILPGQVRITPDYPDSFEDLRVTNTLYAVGDGPNNEAVKIKHNYYQTFFHIGKVEDGLKFISKKQYKMEDAIFDGAPSRLKLNYQVDVHGFEVKEMSNWVAPSWSTYTEARIMPYHPIQNNQVSGLSDANQRIIGVHTKQDQDGDLLSPFATVFKMGDDFKMMTEVVKFEDLGDHEYSMVENTPGMIGQCQVASMGYTTPKNFRHQIMSEENMWWEGELILDTNGNIATEIIPKMQLISAGWNPTETRKVYKADGTRDGALSNRRLWEKYAPNKNWTYKNFNDQFAAEALEPGTMIEVLGRFSVGHIDKYSKTGRDCHYDEIIAAREGKTYVSSLCATQGLQGNIDRYLITSPEIRLADGVSKGVTVSDFGSLVGTKTIEQNNGFNLVGSTGAVNGHIPGTRWVNVVDVDIFKNEFPRMERLSGVMSPNIDAMYAAPQGSCLTVEHPLETRYPNPKETRKHFYKLDHGSYFPDL